MLDTSSTRRGAHAEGRVARAIERRTARLPSDVFLWAAAGSIGLSLGLQAVRRRHLSLFVGQWAPTLLILGLYNKLVKVAGSDRYSDGEEDDRERFDPVSCAETVVEGEDWSLTTDHASYEAAAADDGDEMGFRAHAQREFGSVESPDRYADAPFTPATEMTHNGDAVRRGLSG
ncbi:MAG: hypothetical protein JNL96_04445 [Planctomycetaceae bacterium]|nr:hypothetical protein [Planctomycetaceae bacterium]